MKSEVRAVGMHGVRWQRKRHARGRPNSRLGSRGTRGAHEAHAHAHVAHVRDAGRVEGTCTGKGPGAKAGHGRSAL